MLIWFEHKSRAWGSLACEPLGAESKRLQLCFYPHHEPKVMLKNCVLFDAWKTNAWLVSPSSNPVHPAVELLCGAHILFLLQGVFCRQALLLQPPLGPYSC